MMTETNADQNIKANYDEILLTIAQYVSAAPHFSDLAYDTARWCLMDALGCAFLALQYPACTKLLGPIIPGTVVPKGVRVPGTSFCLDPIQAAFNIGTMVRWLDFNDTWLAAEWGHPSDNLGAIWATMDYLASNQPKTAFKVRDLLTAMIQAHEIQGVLALENGFNRLGFDHVLLVKIASTAVASKLLGGNESQIADALSQAWLDGAALRTYRHAPNTGSRKSWAAGDATARALRLAWMTMQGEMGYRSALTAKKWGFYDVIMKGDALKMSQPFNDYVMENVLFKIAYPAEFHAQTAVEAAIHLHDAVKNRLDQIDSIHIETQESAVRIISKTGPLYNPADRDHSLQYMVAIGLLHGDLKASHYEDNIASDPCIDRLRGLMQVQENIDFSKDYLDPKKRSIANAIQIKFKDGSQTDKVIIEYPIGHRVRRNEGMPHLYQKFVTNAQTIFDKNSVDELLALFQNKNQLENMALTDFVDLFSKV